MKILANKEIKNLFLSLSLVFGVTFLLAEVFLWLSYRRLSLLLLILFLLAGGAVWAVCFVYFNRQNQIMEQAILQINAYLDGDRNARIECDNEGELYRLFHSINSLAAVLNAHADNELREKEFLKNTISDISHQLKTPLAALNIYNGLLQDEDIEVSSVKEFADLSEQELDRIEVLVQSLLKITKLDAGSIAFEKEIENADFNVIPLGGEDIECRILRRNRLRLGSLFRGAGFRPSLGGRFSFRVLVRTSRFSRFLYVLCPRGRGFLTAVSGASGHSAATQQQQSHRGNQAKQTFG